MRRVVVTGMGLVSCIGNNKAEVLRSLREGRSGLEFIPELRELGLQCQVAGQVKGLDAVVAKVGKRPLQTMSNVAKYTAVATL
jgi:3-oxoacyl-[acyl-carrier-protein] synthase I